MPNCINCGTEIQETDKFCRECGKSLKATSGGVSQPNISKMSQPTLESSTPFAVEPKPSEIKLSPAEMVEFQKWQRTVKGGNQVQTTSNKPATVPQQAGEFAKTTGDIFRSFREISDGIKKDLRDVTNISTKPSPPAANVPAPPQVAQTPQKPQLSPEEMIEFNKWRQLVKDKTED